MPKSKTLRGQSSSPISLRLTANEKQQLTIAAKGQTISGHIRHRLFETEVTSSKRAARGQFVIKDHQALAKTLALLGKTSLSANMSKLANAAHMGALPVTDEMVTELHNACADIVAIKSLIMNALAIQED